MIGFVFIVSPRISKGIHVAKSVRRKYRNESTRTLLLCQPKKSSTYPLEINIVLLAVLAIPSDFFVVI
jgi:hypothetical protein